MAKNMVWVWKWSVRSCKEGLIALMNAVDLLFFFFKGFFGCFCNECIVLYYHWNNFNFINAILFNWIFSLVQFLTRFLSGFFLNRRHNFLLSWAQRNAIYILLNWAFFLYPHNFVPSPWCCWLGIQFESCCTQNKWHFCHESFKSKCR